MKRAYSELETNKAVWFTTRYPEDYGFPFEIVLQTHLTLGLLWTCAAWRQSYNSETCWGVCKAGGKDGARMPPSQPQKDHVLLCSNTGTEHPRASPSAIPRRHSPWWTSSGYGQIVVCLATWVCSPIPRRSKGSKSQKKRRLWRWMRSEADRRTFC